MTLLQTDNKERTEKLFKALQREKHGLVADTMEYYGERYGINYGVSLHTIRSTAKEYATDHALAKFVFMHNVRELKLAAITILEPQNLTANELEFWARGLNTNELCEEFALKALRHTSNFWEIFREWALSDNDYKVYTALLAAYRIDHSEFDLAATKQALQKVKPQGTMQAYTARAVVQLLTHITPLEPTALEEYLETISEPTLKSYIKEEVSWRI